MKILILGAGQVGSTVAHNLAEFSQNDVTVVDISEEALKDMSAKLDIQTLVGNAASPRILAEAGADDSDLMLALTRSDETNLVACKLAQTLFNIPTRIARVRQSDYLEYSEQDTLALFDVNESICPEQLVTDHLYELFAYPGALQVLNFANGLAQMVAIRAQNGGLIVGKPLSQLKYDLPEGADCHICAVYRNERLIIPDANTTIIDGDEVFFIASRKDIELILKEVRKDPKHAKKVMIAGGGNIGFRLSRQLEKAFDLKIIENNRGRAEWLSENLDNTLVLNGSVTDESLLEQENIDEIDIFCALTNDDEVNIMSALLAKRYGAKRVMALVNRSSYVDLLQGNTIDIVISPHLSTIGSILAYIRRGDIEAVHPLRRGAAETIEAIIHGDQHTSRLIGRPISKIDLPIGCYISAVVRGTEVILPHDEDIVIREEDHIIFFVARRRLVKEVEKLIQVKVGFF
ncbi:MAG: Trk system potassium transporter TrkA [Neisseriaceae bacterium]|nr:Trk system potassium transporter TrkA [Neisseriaceae bacterium]MBP6860849.1 Trk system potassium transporter TrkA [Neisseriaceae bacterium]